MSNSEDRAEAIMAAWRRERPDLDPSTVGVITRIWHLGRMFTAERRALLTASGIDSALMDLLGTLRRSGVPFALTTRQLAENAAVTPAAISQRLTRAERRGWVAREPGSGRTVLVRLTEAGREVVDATAGAIFEYENRLLAGLSQEQREQLAELLRQLTLSLDDSRASDA